MEIFIYFVAFEIIVFFVVFAIGFNLGKGELNFERTNKGELYTNPDSGALYFDPVDDTNSMVGDADKQKHS